MLGKSSESWDVWPSTKKAARCMATPCLFRAWLQNATFLSWSAKRSMSFCWQPVAQGQLPGCLPFLTFNASTSCTISLLCFKSACWERESSSGIWKGQMGENGTSWTKRREIEKERWKYNKRGILTTKIYDTWSTYHFLLCRFTHICYSFELQI